MRVWKFTVHTLHILLAAVLHRDGSEIQIWPWGSAAQVLQGSLCLQDDAQNFSWAFKPFVDTLQRDSPFLSPSTPEVGSGPPNPSQSISWCPLPPNLASHWLLGLAPHLWSFYPSPCPRGCRHPPETLVSLRWHLSKLSPLCSPMASPAGAFLLLLVTCPLNWLPMAWSSLREGPGLCLYNTYWVLKVCLRKVGRKEARKGSTKVRVLSHSVRSWHFTQWHYACIGHTSMTGESEYGDTMLVLVIGTAYTRMKEFD